MIFQVITDGITEFYNAKDQEHLKTNLSEIDYVLEDIEIIELSEEVAKGIMVNDDGNEELKVFSLWDIAKDQQHFSLLATNDF